MSGEGTPHSLNLEVPMTTRSMLREARWLTLAGLMVSFHRLATGFYLSDDPTDGAFAFALIVLGGLAALVLTGAQMLLAATLAKVRDPLLEVAWFLLLVCAVVVMSASTLASMHGAPLAEILAPTWLRANLPAVVLAVGLSLAIEVALASIRRASTLLAEAERSDDDLDLAEHEVAELEVQRELARHRTTVTAAEDETSSEPEPAAGVTRSCPWCAWSATWPTEVQAANAVRGHQRSCEWRPA